MSAGTALGLAELARAVAAAQGTSHPELRQLASDQGPVLTARIFVPSGQLRAQAEGLPSGLVPNDLERASGTGQRVFLWSLEHKRKDGTAPRGRASDAPTQGYVALALE